LTTQIEMSDPSTIYYKSSMECHQCLKSVWNKGTHEFRSSMKKCLKMIFFSVGK